MKKYSILIDLDRLKDTNNGLGQVAEHLGRVLSSMTVPDMRFTFLVPKQYVGYFGTGVDYEVVSIKRRAFPSLCPKYDLWYTIHQDSRFFPGGGEPYFLTINDLNFLSEKTGFKAWFRLKLLQFRVNKATALSAISNYTVSVIKDNLKIRNLPLHTVYCGVEVKEFPNTGRPTFAQDGDLLFSVGVVQPKKNSMVLIEFMKQLPENYKLVIAGNKSHPYAAEIEAKVAELGLQHRVVLPGLISDEDKYWMFANCKAVLFPSKFEGMGFPPVEAMRLGKPVFASTHSSIPEISGNYAYYWENFEPAYMAETFLKGIANFEANPLLPAQLKKHSLKYTWQNNADTYIDLFRKILESNK